MADNEIKTADEVLGIISAMTETEFEKLFVTLEFNRGWKILYNQIITRNSLNQMREKLGSI